MMGARLGSLSIPAIVLFSAPAATSCKDGSDADDAATDEETDGDAPAPCEWADDGVCDEPANCALGTDETDCVSACASGEDIHLFAAACAYRDPPVDPPDDGNPSGGTLHLTGWRDGTLNVHMGESPRTVDRHYRLFVPGSYDPSRTHPLVVVMPGHRVSHYSLASYTDLGRTADENGFILALAEQQWRTTGENRWAWWTDWAWASMTELNPDFEYLTRLVERVGSEYNMDRRRVFLAGHSRGAAMAYIAALEHPDLFAGACVQSGFTEFGYLDHRAQAPWTARKVPMVIMHGVRDPDVPVAMGDEIVQRLRDLGWIEGEDFLYLRLDNVTHRWQPWLNQIWYGFLHSRPLPEGG